jgi:hypothetical protein
MSGADRIAAAGRRGMWLGGPLAAAWLAVLPPRAALPRRWRASLITASTTVGNDLAECPADGLVIGAGGVTVVDVPNRAIAIVTSSWPSPGRPQPGGGASPTSPGNCSAGRRATRSAAPPRRVRVSRSPRWPRRRGPSTTRNAVARGRRRRRWSLRPTSSSGSGSSAARPARASAFPGQHVERSRQAAFRSGGRSGTRTGLRAPAPCARS